MSMKKFLFIKNGLLPAAYLLVCGLATSCKKLIQIPPNPPTQITAAQVFADSADIMSAVAGVYSNFKVTDAGNTVNSGILEQYTGLSGDELMTSINYDANLLQFFTNQVTPTNTDMATIWSTSYTPLYQVNACLAGIASSTGISAVLKTQLTGELKLVRAFYYFNLVNVFGGVPIVTGTDYRINAVIPRASVDSVYGQIISDLSDAQSLLTADYPSTGRARPNLYTASALLAKVSLYRQQWNEAANLVSQVINTGLYSLEPDLNNVFLDGSKEAIWQLPAAGLYYQTALASTFVPNYPGAVPNYTPTATLLNAFEPGDLRKTTWLDSMVINQGNGDSTYYFPYKYKNISASAATVEDYMMLRLGELYLVRAEALAQQNKLDSAKSDLNIVRTRAGLSPTTAVTQSDLLTAILHERQTELFCEWGNRWYDLKRTQTINTVLSSEKPGWQNTDALYPLPLTELQTNPYLTQNPGY
jgi:hypothetical protein